MGAKSPLSTGVESYRVTSRYNGKEFCFDIYSHKVDSVYGKWNDDGTVNNAYEFQTVFVGEEEYTTTDANGEEVVLTRKIPYKAYYKNTTKKNAVSISIEVRKHNRQQYFEAVKSQLMYLKDEIKFFETNYLGTTSEITFKANILYEDDNIIMSDYNYYTRPHFVIKNVGYGIIDFAELDLSVKFGNIGIKVKMEDIQVTPSRETVIYSTKTRNAILAQYDKVSNTVQSLVQSALNQDQFLDWIRACNKIMYSNSNSNDSLTRLSSLIDKSSLKPKFKGADIMFNSDIKQFVTPLLNMTHQVLTRNYDYKKGKNVSKLSRNDASNMQAFDKPLYLQFTAGNSRVTTYLSSINDKTGGFCILRVAQSYRYLEEAFNQYITNAISRLEFIDTVNALIDATETDKSKITNIKTTLTKTILLIDSLLLGTNACKVEIYSEKLVPESFKANSEELDEDDEKVEQELDFEANLEEIRKNAYAETLKRRKENKLFIASVMMNVRKSTYDYIPKFVKTEVSTKDLDYDNTTILYGTDDDSDAFDILIDTASRSAAAKTNSSFKYFWDDDIKIMKVSKTNVRYVKKEAGLVSTYLISTNDDGILRSCDAIKGIFTANILNEILGKRCRFMKNFREFSNELTDKYEELSSYINKQSNITTLEKFTESNIAKTLLAAYQVQKQLLTHKSINEEDKQDLIDQNIPSTLDLDIIDIDLIDVDKYNTALKLAAFADVFGAIFSYIDPLQDRSLPILDPQLIIEIKSIIDLKKDQLEFQYANIN